MLELIKTTPDSTWREQGQLAGYKINFNGDELLEVDRYDDYHATTWKTFMPIADSITHVIRTQEEYAETYYNNTGYPNPTVLIEHGFGRQPIPQTPLYNLQITGKLTSLITDPQFSLFRLEMAGANGEVAIAYDHLTPPLQGVISTYNDSQVVANMVHRSTILRKDFSTSDLALLLNQTYQGLPYPS